MKSYIKLYGPPIYNALEKLKKVVNDFPNISRGKITHELVPEGIVMIGDYDFIIEWNGNPTPEDIRLLIRSIDDVLKPLDCRYTITTKE